MAIYKPSNCSPSQEEVDFTKDVDFQCQINTSGEPVKDYELTILSEDGEDEIYNYRYSEENDTKINIKNKKTLTHTLTAGIEDDLVNNKNYQWKIRTFNQLPETDTSKISKQPNTLVCSGYLTGTTRYVIWMEGLIPGETQTDGTKNDDILSQIAIDRYIEFTDPNDWSNNYNSAYKDLMGHFTKDQVLPVIYGNEDNSILQYKDIYDKYTSTKKVCTQRKKIDYVTNGLGRNKDLTKIELDDEFTYNFINGTPFTVYQCTNEHTLTSVYVDPNDEIQSAFYIVLYPDYDNFVAAEAYYSGLSKITDITTPPSSFKLASQPKKIMGYSSDTGEVRVGENFDITPTNSMFYLIFEYDAVNQVYIEHYKDTHQKVGGWPIYYSNYFKTKTTNVAQSGETATVEMFIQPNINIKTDSYMPDELVLDCSKNLSICSKAGYDLNSNYSKFRIKLTKETAEINGKLTDITFDKLDNTQWLIRANAIYSCGYYDTSNAYTESTSISSTIDALLFSPKTPYKVYTASMDSEPYNLIYARNTPTLTIKRQKIDGIDSEEADDYIEISSDTIKSRDITFYTEFTPGDYNDLSIKYYHYYLYDNESEDKGDLIAESEDLYDSELLWTYKGFLSSSSESSPQFYCVKVQITDNYDKVWTKQVSFGIYYDTEEGTIALQISYICDEKCFCIDAHSPALLYSKDMPEESEHYGNDDLKTDTITDDNLALVDNVRVIDTSDDQILNYYSLSDDDNTNIKITNEFSLLTQFKIGQEILDTEKISNGQMYTILSFAHEKLYSLIEENNNDNWTDTSSSTDSTESNSSNSSSNSNGSNTVTYTDEHGNTFTYVNETIIDVLSDDAASAVTKVDEETAASADSDYTYSCFEKFDVKIGGNFKYYFDSSDNKIKINENQYKLKIFRNIELTGKQDEDVYAEENAVYDNYSKFINSLDDGNTQNDGQGQLADCFGDTAPYHETYYDLREANNALSTKEKLSTEDTEIYFAQGDNYDGTFNSQTVTIASQGIRSVDGATVTPSLSEIYKNNQYYICPISLRENAKDDTSYIKYPAGLYQCIISNNTYSFKYITNNFFIVDNISQLSDFKPDFDQYKEIVDNIFALQLKLLFADDASAKETYESYTTSDQIETFINDKFEGNVQIFEEGYESTSSNVTKVFWYESSSLDVFKYILENRWFVFHFTEDETGAMTCNITMSTTPLANS